MGVAMGVVKIGMIRSVKQKRSANCSCILAKRFLTEVNFGRCAVLVHYQDLTGALSLVRCWHDESSLKYFIFFVHILRLAIKATQEEAGE